ncbi:putative alkylated DNA repair protein [Caulobacter phage Cr30]|uniref:alkylated DNA repair n=1 Tax=Caulobacter phage Cr30 TaxID=1357714 RepID=UPI0004A9B47F|nr:alkylated DNA repair [Caulobacter phage Cr30]AGS81122.1 putative alkylated DNA repair protein [Caulobacter phage Cr30]
MKAPVTYFPNWISPISQNSIFDELLKIDWVQVPGRPRREYWAAEKPYTYGSGLATHTYDPQPWPDIVRDICSDLSYFDDWQGLDFDGCFLNRYDNARDHLGWHADDSPSIDHERPIAIVTLGEGREIQFKEQNPDSEIETLFLEPGSLCMMHAGMQQTHFHRIPKSSKSHIGTRISLTFRGLV